MSAPDLAAMRARCAAATEGPWVFMDGETFYGEIRSASQENASFTLICDMGDGAQSEGDFEFIAHARTDVPALLDEVERLRTRLALAEKVVDVAYGLGIPYPKINGEMCFCEVAIGNPNYRSHSPQCKAMASALAALDEASKEERKSEI